ncbi:MAG: acyl-CoA thioesterase/BAAT N-terminal domain-containing protein [Myxococcaceae bacterium]|nr:acyl-CoA thioesterase/BAAT N-terminal domain-containing protein [Myxococcaceae bacterium]
MRSVVTAFVVLALGCGPARGFEGGGSGPFEYDVDDPRCIPTLRDYAPTIRVAADGGAPDAGFLAWESAEILVEGLPPCRPLDMIFGQAVGGFAYAVFRADFDGVVSTARQAPVSGSWRGVDADGPIYSSEGGLFVQNVNVLADWGASAYLEVTWPRRALSRGVDVLPVRGARGVYGDLYLPASAAPWPILIAIGGREGGSAVTNELARTFVEQGYLVLALSYWGIETLPARMDRLPLEYFLSAIEVAKEYPGARMDRVGLIGVGRGGEAALLVGSLSTQVKAVVSVVGSGVSWPAADPWTEPTWTFQDAGVPHVPWVNAQPVTRTRPDGGVEVTQREQWSETLRQASPQALEAATIAVERIGGPVLLLSAGDDQVWPSCSLSDVAWARLVDAGHVGRFSLDGRECYPGAGHALNPGFVGLPMGSTLFVERPDGGVFDALGGSPQANGEGSRAAWRRASAFLEAALKQ